MTITILGQTPSGKNQVQLLWRNGKVHRYPNKTFTTWREQATRELRKQVVGMTAPMSTPVGLECAYWPGDKRTRDVSGQLDALFSLLVYANILKDDGLVHDVLWRRCGLDRTGPRLIVTITDIKVELVMT